RDVPGGDLWSYTARGFSRGQKSTFGSAGVWTGPRDGTQDVGLFDSAGLPAERASQAAQAGTVGRRDRRDSGRRQDPTSQTAAYRAADLRSPAGGARVFRRRHDREGLRACRRAAPPRDVRSGGADRSVSGRPRSGLPLLRRRSQLDSVRQHSPGGGADSGRRYPAEDAGVFRVTKPPSVCREVRTTGEGQRQRQGGGLGGLRTAELSGADSEGGQLGRVEPAVAGRVPGAASAEATRPAGDDRRTL